MSVHQEFSTDPARDGQHRLVCKMTGAATDWASYCQTTYLNGMVGFTAFYADKEGVLEATKFCEMISVGKTTKTSA